MRITDEAEQAAMDALALVPLPPSVHLGNVVATVLHAAAPHLLADDETSDGFHTVGEIYYHRMLLNAALFHSWYLLDGQGLGPDADVHLSWRHSDGELCFGGGWFIVVAQLPTGQVSYHYEAKYRDLFRIPEREIPAPFDGHTPEQAAARIREYLEA